MGLKNKDFELWININPNIEDIMSDFFFADFPTEGIILSEETYKNLEMTATTSGNLRIFLAEKPIDINKKLTRDKFSPPIVKISLASWPFICWV